MTLLFTSVLPWLLVATGTWLGYQLVRQNGRILLRLESIEKHVRHRPAAPKRQEPAGLPVGTLATDFELPDLTGARRKLSDFRGKNLLLIFFNPNCGFCTRMAADLAALPHSSSDRTLAGEWSVPIVVTTGDADENRRFFEQHGIRCVVLLQEQMEVASQFGVQGTPMGYRLNGAGRIASELAVGAEPLLQLATSVAFPQNESGSKTNGSAKKHQQPDPSLAKSKLNRNGLKAGTPAPDFRLPLLDGGDLSLATFRGGRVLLVFSSPDCGPCDELSPQLEQLHRERLNLQVLVVSRGDVEANRAKATKLGLSYPIVLQKQWEISLQYAMFTTPIGYLIDEHGILLSDVAIGVGPILALANEPVEESYNADPMLTEREQAWAI